MGGWTYKIKGVEELWMYMDKGEGVPQNWATFGKSRKTSQTSKDVWHLCKFCVLLITADVRKNHTRKNLTGYWSKDYYCLSI